MDQTKSFRFVASSCSLFSFGKSLLAGSEFQDSLVSFSSSSFWPLHACQIGYFVTMHRSWPESLYFLIYLLMDCHLTVNPFWPDVTSGST